MEAKRRALDEIAARQTAADEKRKGERSAAGCYGGKGSGYAPIDRQRCRRAARLSTGGKSEAQIVGEILWK